MTEASTQTLLVMGCHRSGTSAVAGALGHLGLALPRNLLGAGRGNVLGHFEPAAMVRFNDRLLDGLERNWFDPKPLADGWQAGAAAHHAEAAGLWEDERLPGTMVLKDPRFSRLLPLWRQILPEAPLAVIVCRNPYEVAASLKSRDGIDKKHGLMLWESYLLEAEAATRGLKRLLVHYAALLEDRAGVVAQLAAFAGIEPDAAARAAAEASIAKGAAHKHEQAEEFFARPKVPQPVKDLYRLALQPNCLDDQAGFDHLRGAWAERWRQSSPGDGPSPQALARPEIHYARSLRAIAEQAPDDALEAARKAAAAAPQSTRFGLHLGRLLVRAGLHEPAIAALRPVLARDPKLAAARYLLIEALRGARQAEDAVAEARVALAAGPPGAALLMLAAEAMADARLFDEAAFTIARAVGAGGPAAEASLLLANVLRRSGHPADAQGHLREAWRLAEARPDLRRRAAQLMAKCGAAEEAAAWELGLPPLP